MKAGFLKPGRGKCLINADLRDICDEPEHQANLQSWSEADEWFWSESGWEWRLHQNEVITSLFSENDLITPQTDMLNFSRLKCTYFQYIIPLQFECH